MSVCVHVVNTVVNILTGVLFCDLTSDTLVYTIRVYKIYNTRIQDIQYDRQSLSLFAYTDRQSLSLFAYIVCICCILYVYIVCVYCMYILYVYRYYTCMYMLYMHVCRLVCMHLLHSHMSAYIFASIIYDVRMYVCM